MCLVRKTGYPMATLEERLTRIEYAYDEIKNDNTGLKKTIELQTIALGALVNKAMLEKLNEKNDKVFDALIAHDQFTNAQLAELRDHHIELDGKFVGLQTETRQGFTEIRQRFEQQDQKIDQILRLLNTLTNKPE